MDIVLRAPDATKNASRRSYVSHDVGSRRLLSSSVELDGHIGGSFKLNSQAVSALA